MRFRNVGVALLAACLPSACAGWDRDLNPFYVGHVSETSGVPEEQIVASSTSFGPLYDERSMGGRTVERALHPLFRYHRAADSSRVQVLHPLFQSRFTPRLSEWRFLPLVWYRRYHPGNRPAEWDLMLLPLLFAGGGSPQERSFALFPLAGKVRAFAGFAELSFFLFPFYYRLHKNITGAETFHNITPLFGWVNGGPRDGSWRALPFYANWKWAGKSNKQSWLWPIFHYQRNALDTDDPSRLFAIWPLFKVDQNRTHRFVTLLWPFFRFNVEEPAAHGPTADSTDAAPERYHRVDVLWPLYRSDRNREFTRTRLFPFFSRYRSDELDSDGYAIPLFWKRETRGLLSTARTFNFVPFVHRERVQYRDGRPASTATRIWPLLGYENDGAGAKQLDIPVLSPIQIDRFTADFVANWGPWFRLYSDRRAAGGDRHIEVLFRLVQYRREGDRRHWSLPFVYSGDRREERTTHDLLLGLIRVGTGRGGLELRLLGLPLVRPGKGGR